MTTFNTGNPIGSTDARDRSDNSENLDLAVNSLALTFEDRLGVTRDTLEGIYQKSAYYRAGTFEAGYTLTNNRQTMAYGNIEYSWSGAFPKVVPPSSTPATTGGVVAGAWVDRTDSTMRSSLEQSVLTNRFSGRYALSDIVSVNDFGAVGDGAYHPLSERFSTLQDAQAVYAFVTSLTQSIDYAAIQAAIDFAQNASGVGYSKFWTDKFTEIIFPGSGYVITDELKISENGVHLVALGRCSITGYLTISNEQFIINVNPSNSAIDQPYGIKIRGFLFDRVQANPFKQDYDSASFGSGASYSFKTSCNGVSIYDTHYSVVEDCDFVGLRCGLKQMGCWSTSLIGLRFNYNDRHIYGNKTGSSSNNAVTIEKCVFGSSVMTAGVYLEEYSSVVLRDIDYENAHQSPFFFRLCRAIISEGYLYFEQNLKYSGNTSAPAYINESTAFMPISSDLIAGIGSKYLITFNACRNMSFKNASSTNQVSVQEGLSMNAYCQTAPVFDCVRYVGNPASYIFNSYSTTATGHIVSNFESNYFHKAANPTYPFKSSQKGGVASGQYAVPTTWHIDPVNGSDDTPTTSMSSSNKIKSLNLLSIPDGGSDAYTVNIYSSGGSLVFPDAPDAVITVDGQSMAGTISNLYMNGVTQARVNSLNITGGVWRQQSSSDTAKASRLSLRMEGVSCNYNQAGGLFNGFVGGEITLFSCTFTQNNAANYVFVVQSGLDVWASACTFNKRVEVRNYGHYYYGGNSEPTPVVGSGYYGLIQSVSVGV